ncbi:MAG: MBL fold metallo-hydrolase [Selenomonadaceae bacterium]|nr:MBL fold metallo-hydrolase [Selenomonadaceae bacterium]
MDRRTFILGGLGALGLLSGGGFYFVNQPKFGRLPSGERLERIKASPHYVNGQFQCLNPVQIMTNPDENRFLATYKFIMRDKTNLFPKEKMLSKKTDLRSIPSNENVLIWMGHSTFYLQIYSYKILIDPVFSSYGSPIFFINKAFDGSNIYTAEDFPEIDVLAITHDHWDHLDYSSVMALKPKIKKIVCPLGVGEYFEQWNFDLNKIHEEDWYTEINLFDNLKIHILPSQHFSGRFLTSNPTEWCSFAFITPKLKVFCSGDGGYGSHFKDIGQRFNGFDLALMENGQYNERWHNIHLMPEETAQATVDVGAKQLVTSHNGKFALAYHDWKEPFNVMDYMSKDKPFERLTPMIGEKVYIGQAGQKFTRWWTEME